MSNAHKGSRLILKDQVVVTDFSSMHFDYSKDATGLSYGNLIEPSSSSVYTVRTDGKFGGGVAVEEGTTNLIPGLVNMYPTYGNQYGTYNTNQYNNNTYFSIGTITSVTDNIVTYVPTKSLRTYDVVRPQTSGGGLIAGVIYFIKAISTTQFTVHQYNSSQDGSLGFAVHDSINNDIRIPINATDFPTMWHGPPHQPNSGLVKEIIPSGFHGIHDCLRLYTNYRSDGVADFMAYGVRPLIEANKQYTVSFYHRAITPETVGRTSSFSMHNGVGFGGGSFVLTNEWKRFENVVSSTVTGNASMYWNAGYGIVWDIAEIQCEEKTISTSFTTETRATGLIDYSDYGIKNIDEGAISVWFNPLSGFLSTVGSAGWRRIVGQATTVNVNEIQLMRDGNTNKICFTLSDLNGTPNLGLWNSVKSTTVFENNKWYHIVGAWSKANGTVKLYVNGKKENEATGVTQFPSAIGKFAVGYHPNVSDRTMNGMMADLVVYEVEPSEDDIEAMYISEKPMWNPYDYRSSSQ